MMVKTILKVVLSLIILFSGDSVAKNIVFINDDVQDFRTIIDALKDDYSYHLINSQNDGIQQISKYLKTQKDISAIHIISHGSSGELHLGSKSLSSKNIAQYNTELKNIGRSIKADGDILLYGCNIAKGKKGQQFISQLSQLTAVDIAASTNKTGSSLLEADWKLEAYHGQIDTKNIYNKSLGSYPYVLETMTFGSGPRHTGFSLSGWNSGGGTIWTANLAGESRITKNEGTFNLTSILVGTPYYEGNTRKIESDKEHSIIYKGRKTLTLNWNKITWIRFTRLSGGAASGDVDNVIFTANAIIPTVVLGSDGGFSTSNKPTLTVSQAGLNTVTGAIGPTPGDISDPFYVDIPAGFGLKSIEYSGPGGDYFPKNVVGCGITGSDNFNQTFSTQQTNCTLDFNIATNFSTVANPWTVFLEINSIASITGAASNLTIDDTETATPFSPLSVEDAEGDNVSVNISYPAANGTITGEDLTGSAGNYTLSTDTIENINTKLHELQFTPTINQVPPGLTKMTTFTLTANDGANGIPNSDTQITVTNSKSNVPAIDLLLLSN